MTFFVPKSYRFMINSDKHYVYWGYFFVVETRRLHAHVFQIFPRAFSCRYHYVLCYFPLIFYTAYFKIRAMFVRDNIFFKIFFQYYFLFSLNFFRTFRTCVIIPRINSVQALGGVFKRSEYDYIKNLLNCHAGSKTVFKITYLFFFYFQPLFDKIQQNRSNTRQKAYFSMFLPLKPAFLYVF